MPQSRLPDWLRRPPGSAPEAQDVKRLLRASGLSTVCEEARCPNTAECFARRTATFLILGDRCTRDCSFCSVQHGTPLAFEPEFRDEARNILRAVLTLGLRYAVVTSVTRDDLPDGGASGFTYVLQILHNEAPEVQVEVLIPDFQGEDRPLQAVLNARPAVLNHNLETVPRLYPLLRPQADYHRSLRLLRRAKDFAPDIPTKTGIMLGLGETREEVLRLMTDAREQDIQIFTAGQYLQPTVQQAAPVEYLRPEDFQWYREQALRLGFREAAVGPLVRSSYRAEETARTHA